MPDLYGQIGGQWTSPFQAGNWASSWGQRPQGYGYQTPYSFFGQNTSLIPQYMNGGLRNALNSWYPQWTSPGFQDLPGGNVPATPKPGFTPPTNPKWPQVPDPPQLPPYLTPGYVGSATPGDIGAFPPPSAPPDVRGNVWQNKPGWFGPPQPPNGQIPVPYPNYPGNKFANQGGIGGYRSGWGWF